jgi:hypothetical protein
MDLKNIFYRKKNVYIFEMEYFYLLNFLCASLLISVILSFCLYRKSSIKTNNTTRRDKLFYFIIYIIYYIIYYYIVYYYIIYIYFIK